MTNIGDNAKQQLLSIIERVENLEEQKRELQNDIKEIFAEAKGNGFDTKALRTIVRLRRMDKQLREEFEAILDTYMHALGMS